MKNVVILLMPILIAFAIPLMAGQDEYDDCLLQHLRSAKLDIATQLIEQACEENYKDPAYTPKKRLAYNQCLLEYLPGVESIRAVISIQAACNRKHH